MGERDGEREGWGQREEDKSWVVVVEAGKGHLYLRHNKTMPFDIITLTIIDNFIYISSDLSNVNENMSTNVYESPLFICTATLG